MVRPRCEKSEVLFSKIEQSEFLLLETIIEQQSMYMYGTPEPWFWVVELTYFYSTPNSNTFYWLIG